MGIIVYMAVWEQFLSKVASGPVTSNSDWLLSLNLDGIKESFFWRNPKDKVTVNYALAGNLTACKSVLENEDIDLETLGLLRNSLNMDSSIMAALHPRSSYYELLNVLDRWRGDAPCKFKGRFSYYLSSDFDVFQRFRDANQEVREFIFRNASIESLAIFLKVVGDRLRNVVSTKEEDIIAYRLRSFSPDSESFLPFLRAYAKYFYPKSDKLRSALSSLYYYYPSLGDMVRWWLNPSDRVDFEVIDQKLFDSMLYSLSTYSDTRIFLKSNLVHPVALLNNPRATCEDRLRVLKSGYQNIEVLRAAIHTIYWYYFSEGGISGVDLNDSTTNFLDGYKSEASLIIDAVVKFDTKSATGVKTGYLLKSFLSANYSKFDILLEVIPVEYHFMLATLKESNIEKLLLLPAQAVLLRYDNPGELLSYLLKELEPGEVEIFASLVDEFDGTLESLIYVAKTCSSKGLIRRVIN
jgi:hypothetical protein